MVTEQDPLAIPPSIYLIDASIYIFQAHFSPYVECADTGGEDLSAVFGFTQFLFQFMRRTSPQFVAVARDESLQTGFRHELYPDYKSNRELPDENLKRQLDGCSHVVKALGLADFCSQVYEADDILGTLASKAQTWMHPDAEICIVSRDKDLAQLLKDERCSLWDYSGNKKRYRQDIVADYGVYPEQFPDYLGLVGDSVDMIQGVPGVGPVKAKALLANFGTLEAMFDSLAEIEAMTFRGAKRLPEVLGANKESAFLSKQLATIVCDMDLKEESLANLALENLQTRPASEEGLLKILTDLNFRQAEIDRLLFQLNKLLAAQS